MVRNGAAVVPSPRRAARYAVCIVRSEMPRSVEMLLLALAVLFPVAVTAIVVSRLIGFASVPADQVGVEGAATRVATATKPVLGSTTRATPTVRPTNLPTATGIP